MEDMAQLPRSRQRNAPYLAGRNDALAETAAVVLGTAGRIVATAG